MLFEQSSKKELSKELFQNPGCEYRGAPFWSWNCKLEEKELLWQLEMLKEMGMGGAHMHVRTGMETAYLSREHMDLVKACVEKCRQEDLKAWLYDEDRWPSGAAGGIVTKEKQYRAKHLLFTVNPYEEGKEVPMSYIRQGAMGRCETGTLLTCFDVSLDENGYLKSFCRVDRDAVCQGTKWYVYLETPTESPWFNYQTYVDTLSKEALARFIDITYEAYWEKVGKDFGGIVPAIFTDEPQFTHKSTLDYAKEKKDVTMPWTTDFADTFRAAYGTEILDSLPELLWDLPDGKVSVIRYQYHDHVAERFASAFADQCGAWCEAHNLMFTGHLMLEGTLSGQTKAVGEAMRSYRSFQLPGIDMLNHRTEFTTAKQAQSASHQYGREGVLSELYGVTGWDFDFRGHKFHGDWQAALGVTVRVPHLSWVTMKGEAKRDYPAAISYQSPWWKNYRYVEDHFARVNTAMTRGKPLVRVGVIHPIESFWLRFGPEEHTASLRKQMEENYQNLTRWLLEECLDFDFICEALLPDLCENAGAPLKVGCMEYDAVVVPACETLRSSTLERLEAFQRAGGKLIFLGAAPKYENACDSPRGKELWEKSVHTQFTKEALTEALESVRMVEIRLDTGIKTTSLLHQVREDGEDRWLFVAHSVLEGHRDVPKEKNIRIWMDGEYSVQKYDTLSGQILPVSYEISGGKTVVTETIYQMDSLLLRYSALDEKLPCAVKKNRKVRSVLKVPALVKYELDEENVCLLDKAEFALDQEPYEAEMEILRADDVLRERLGWFKRQSAMAQPWVIPEPKPQHVARMRFTLHCAEAFDHVKLALEDAESAEIFLNGKKVLAKPEGYFTDKSIQTVLLGSLKKGENYVEVSVPFGRRVGMEWCYLLGDFGVKLCGEWRELIPREKYLGFDDVTRQGLVHYGGNVTYHIPMETRGGSLSVTVPQYAGAALLAELNGEKQYLVYPPYEIIFDGVPAGTQELKLTLLGHRHNCFGPVHLADVTDLWIGPNAWRSVGVKWTESYRLKPLGIHSAPVICELEEE